MLILISSLARIPQLLDFSLHSADSLILLLVEILPDLVHLGLLQGRDVLLDPLIVSVFLASQLEDPVLELLMLVIHLLVDFCVLFLELFLFLGSCS